MNSLKENAFFFSPKCAVQKQIHHLACWSPFPSLPPLEPCADMANRRQPSDWLRGRELPRGTAPGSDLHSHMYWWRWVFFVLFLVSFELSWDLCFKGSFHWGANQAEAGSHKGIPLPIRIRDPLGPQGPPCIDKSSWRGDVSLRKSTYFRRDLLLIISFQKISRSF